MRKLQKFGLSLSVMLLAGLPACGLKYVVIPDLGAAFVDMENDAEGSTKRLTEFDVVCVAPTREEPPKLAMAPAWCAWTMSADKTIRVNNRKAHH